MHIEGSTPAQFALTRQQLISQQHKDARGSLVENPPAANANPRSADSAQFNATTQIDNASTTQALAETIEAPPAPVYGDDDISRLQAAWGTTTRGDGFLSEYDFNADGAIDGADLSQLLGLYGTEKVVPDTTALPANYGESDIVGLRAAWNLQQGDEGFRQDYDFNGDGIINGSDLGQLLGKYGLARDGAVAPGAVQARSDDSVDIHPDDSVDIDPGDFISVPGGQLHFHPSGDSIDESVDIDPSELGSTAGGAIRGHSSDDSVDFHPDERDAIVGATSAAPSAVAPDGAVPTSAPASTDPAITDRALGADRSQVSSLAATQVDATQIDASQVDATQVDAAPINVTIADDSVLFSVLLPNAELQAFTGITDPARDARDLSLLLEELHEIQDETHEQGNESRAAILADVRSAFTELLGQPLEARDSLSLLLGRLSSGSALG